MYVIDFEAREVEVGEKINFFGKVKINGQVKDVVCSVTNEFLKDISGSEDYLDVFKGNRFTVETIAEDKLNKMSNEELLADKIYVDVNTTDIPNYEL